MRQGLAICCLLGGLAGGVRAQQPSEAQIRSWVFALVHPGQRLLVQEKLLLAGAPAVPHLVKAVQERDCRVGKKGWTSILNDPDLADLQDIEITAEAVVAALKVLEEMGAVAKDGLPGLRNLYRPNSYGRSQGDHLYQRELYEAIVSIGVQSGGPADIEILASLGHRLAVSLDPGINLSAVVELMATEKFVGFRRPDYVAACNLLSHRLEELHADPKLRARLLSALLKVARNHSPESSILPMTLVASGRQVFGAAAAGFARTQVHDRASLLLAKIDPRIPWAARGLLVRLESIRSAVRLRVAMHLGRHGERSMRTTFALLRRLKDPVARVRQAAITSLGMQGEFGRVAIPYLRILAAGQDKHAAVLARAALKKVDPEPSELWTYLHFNGRKQSEGKCKGVQKTGLWTFWDYGGNKTWEGSFVDDQMHGDWKHYGPTRTRTYRYEHGVRVGQKSP